MVLKRVPVVPILPRSTYVTEVVRRRNSLETGQSFRPTTRVPLVTFRSWLHLLCRHRVRVTMQSVNRCRFLGRRVVSGQNLLVEHGEGKRSRMSVVEVNRTRAVRMVGDLLLAGALRTFVR